MFQLNNSWLSSVQMATRTGGK